MVQQGETTTSKAGPADGPPDDLTIQVRGVSKSFGATKAVDNLTFDVRRGEVVGFLGPNGAGKTTTMRPFDLLLHARHRDHAHQRGGHPRE